MIYAYSLGILMIPFIPVTRNGSDKVKYGHLMINFVRKSSSSRIGHLRRQ